MLSKMSSTAILPFPREKPNFRMAVDHIPDTALVLFPILLGHRFKNVGVQFYDRGRRVGRIGN